MVNIVSLKSNCDLEFCHAKLFFQKQLLFLGPPCVYLKMKDIVFLLSYEVTFTSRSNRFQSYGVVFHFGMTILSWTLPLLGFRKWVAHHTHSHFLFNNCTLEACSNTVKCLLTSKKFLLLTLLLLVVTHL